MVSLAVFVLLTFNRFDVGFVRVAATLLCGCHWLVSTLSRCVRRVNVLRLFICNSYDNIHSNDWLHVCLRTRCCMQYTGWCDICDCRSIANSHSWLRESACRFIFKHESSLFTNWAPNWTKTFTAIPAIFLEVDKNQRLYKWRNMRPFAMLIAPFSHGFTTTVEKLFGKIWNVSVITYECILVIAIRTRCAFCQVWRVLPVDTRRAAEVTSATSL